jgi:hypothetical protein
MSPAFEFLDDQCEAAVQSGRIETLAPVDGLVELLDSWRRDLQDPTDVLGGYKVPGWPQDVRSEEVSAVELGLYVRNIEPRGPHAERPQGMGVFLRLHTPKQPHDICCARQARSLQPLRG